MIKSATATSLVVLLLALSPTAAQAEDIKDMVSDTQLAEFCNKAGVDTETTAQLTVNGQTVIGTIHCEAEDMVAGSDDLEDDLEDEDEEEESEDDDDESEDDDDDDSEDSEDSDDSNDSQSEDGDDSEDD